LSKLGLTQDEIIKRVLSNIPEVPKTFQEQFLEKAQTVFERFKECITGKAAAMGPEMESAWTDLVSVVNDSIRMGLIGTAQKGMEAFRNCVTSKMWDLPGTQEQVMNQLVQFTNTSIQEGLLGEAQKNVAAFVQCSGSKQLQMVQQIQGYLKTMEDSYKYAMRQVQILTLQGKKEEAAIWQNYADDILNRIIPQLQVWLKQMIDWKPKVRVKPEVDIDTSDIERYEKWWEQYWGQQQADTSKVVKILGENSDALAKAAAVQAALDNLKDKVITITVNYVTWGTPPSSFQYGGVVPGPIGKPQLVVAHGGERFLGPSTTTIHQPVTMYNQISSNLDLDVATRRIIRSMTAGYHQKRDIS